VIKGLAILVIDDESALRESMKLLLEYSGCEVETCANGPAALAKLKQRRFDVVITDFSMPGMPGDQLVAPIRKLVPNQRILMATGFAEEYKVFGKADAAVDGLLYKPFTIRELEVAIIDVLAPRTADEQTSIPPPPSTASPDGPRLDRPPNH